MARIRTIKPEFWTDEELSALPEATHMLAAALLNYSDDFGYFNANVGLIRAACTPLREPSVSIPESLRSLQTMGYLRLGTAPDGKKYGHVVKFNEHQRVSHPTPSKIADLSIAWDVYGSPPEPLRNPPESFRPERNREQGKEQGKETTASATPLVPRETDDWFLNFKLVYPSRAGDQGWRKAARAANARMAEGHTPDEFIAGAARYAAFCAATDSTDTAFVKQAATFLGPDKPFLLPWTPPATKGQRQLESNISAGLSFLAGGKAQ